MAIDKVAKRKAKPNNKPEATEAATKAQAIEESPYAEIARCLNRYRLGAVLGILVTVALFGASVLVVIYSGANSMHAFEELPKYRVNGLVLDYRQAVRAFDSSLAATQAKLEGDPARTTLTKARGLSEQILQSEQAFDQLLAHYGEAMAAAAEQVGGALEWNRYFQADIQSLRDASAARQLNLRAIVDSFPAPNLPAVTTDATGTVQPTGTAQPEPASESGADHHGKN